MKNKRIIVALIIAGILFKIVISMNQKRGENRVIKVEVAKPEKRILKRNMLVRYYIKPFKCAEFVIPAKSRIYRFTQKDLYKKGEVIFEISNPMDSIKAEVALVDYHKALYKFENTRRLFNAGILSRKEYIKDSLDLLKSLLNLKKIKEQISATVFRAPFSGFISTSEDLYTGKYIPEHLKIKYCSDLLTLHIYFPQYFIPYIEYLPDTVFLNIITPFERSVKVKYLHITNSVKKEGDDFYCEATYLLTHKDSYMKPGINGFLSFYVSTNDSVVCVPSDAIAGVDFPYVFVVKQHRAYKVPVKIGFIGDSFTEVIGGVTEQDSIVIGPPSSLILLRDSVYVSY